MDDIQAVRRLSWLVLRERRLIQYRDTAEQEFNLHLQDKKMSLVSDDVAKNALAQRDTIMRARKELAENIQEQNTLRAILFKE